jgi:hypothetical protein
MVIRTVETSTEKAAKTAIRGRRARASAQLRARLLAQLSHYINKEAGTPRARKRAVRATRAAEEFIDLDNPVPPPPRRGRGRPKFWIMAVGQLSTQEIANAILAECWRTWLRAEGALPTTLSVAKGIARRLGVHGDKVIQVGRALLRIAELAEIVREVRTYRKVPLITFTDEVEELLCREFDLISESQALAQGLREQPITGPVAARRAKYQSLAPFEPKPGTSPWDAAERVRATRWHVNKSICTIAGEWLQAQFDLMVVENGWRAALRKYGSVKDAYEQARTGLQVGYLAVGWDHRGRLNQVDSALTYTSGSDLARAILEFDEAKPVRTEEGRLALARHVLNQWSGEEARTIAHGSELEWLDACQQTIGRIADDGVIVTDASHPLRLVAACRAWRAAERGEAIRLPVSIDATTSMLQHMALLLRDPDLARLSNLWPGARQDFYTEVAQRCPPLTRKAVKGVAMPMFYGQTNHSAMDVLREEGVSKPRLFATRIRAAGADIAPKAFALYEALRAVAKELTAHGQPVQWTTPSGWQCVTDCRRDDRIVHTIKLPDGATRQYTETVPGTKLHTDRQQNAITANLIHSCDAALLHLTVAALPDAVTSIAVAHDCFAVHADDVPVLRATLMATLGRMYADDLLARWWTVWEGAAWSRGARSRVVAVPLPERGVWDDRFLQGQYTFC